MTKSKYFKHFVLLMMTSFIMGTSLTLNAQAQYGDFTYDKNAIRDRKVISYPPLREADVMFSWRVCRIIDTREKMNVIMNWPRNPFYKIIYDAVTVGYGSAPLLAYRNDSLLTHYTAEEVLNIGGDEQVVEVCPDPDYPEDCYDSTVSNPFLPNTIERYKICEDWIFDKQRSMFFGRIFAIAPQFKWKVAGIELEENDLFWLKWEDVKKVLVNQELFNRHNDALRLSYLDFFELRMFSSYVVKESNAFDNYISDFEEFKANEFAALLESEKIKERLFDWEHDLWEW